MSLKLFFLRRMLARGDAKRDASLKIPEGVEIYKDINYLGNNDKWNCLDVYQKKDAKEPVPTIISIHGGAYIYGTKENYKYYGMYWATEGFTFVNFNYHLAPKNKFPGQLKEINDVMLWVSKNADKYHIDKNNIFLIGDSAGAQMCSHYAAIYSNSVYEELFPFSTPKDLKIRALALNCGMYNITPDTVGKSPSCITQDLFDMYVEKVDDKTLERLKVLENVIADYPPSFIMTSYYDFLKDNAEPMYNFLKGKGISTRYKCYGTKEQKYMAHVCNVNMKLDEAKEICQDEINFFKEFVQ